MNWVGSLIVPSLRCDLNCSKWKDRNVLIYVYSSYKYFCNFMMPVESATVHKTPFWCLRYSKHKIVTANHKRQYFIMLSSGIRSISTVKNYLLGRNI